MMYADDRRTAFRLKLENPAPSMFSAVFLVRWHSDKLLERIKFQRSSKPTGLAQ
jgi:hypothetical protein